MPLREAAGAASSAGRSQLQGIPPLKNADDLPMVHIKGLDRRFENEAHVRDANHAFMTLAAITALVPAKKTVKCWTTEMGGLAGVQRDMLVAQTGQPPLRRLSQRSHRVDLPINVRPDLRRQLQAIGKPFGHAFLIDAQFTIGPGIGRHVFDQMLRQGLQASQEILAAHAEPIGRRQEPAPFILGEPAVLNGSGKQLP